MSRARETARLISNDTFRIDSNNAVGFGSTTPDAMFDINAGLTVAGIITASGGISGAGTLETQQLSITGVSTFQNNIHLLDDDRLQIGGSVGTVDGLEIYHDGSDSYINDTGTGALQVRTSALVLRSNVGENMAFAYSNGAVQLYHNNSKTFETTTTGIEVFNGASTSATIGGPDEIVIDPATVGDNTGSVRIKGDLFVDGTTTQINSTTLELADFIVGIATTATTDTLADGAGIQIGPDNTFLYEYNSGTNPSLKSSENLNVATGKHYQIGETEVLNATTLGSGVVNSSLTSVGTLTGLTVSGDISIADKIVHTGDTNTAIRFPGNDRLTVETAGSERVRINSSGNIGIGTNNPGTKLVVAASDSTAADMRFQNSSTGYAANNGMWVGINNNEDGLIYNYHNSPLIFGTNDNERLRIDSAGLVGIGTDNPSTNLEVIGGIKAKNTTGSSTLTIEAKNNQLSGVHFSDDAATLGKINYFHSDDSLRFTTNGSERLAILSSGLVGIGTDNPVAKLHALGTIKLEGDVEIAPTNSGGEGGQIILTNPDKSSVGAVIDVSGANVCRIFNLNNNSILEMGQLSGTGGTILFKTQGVDRLKIDSSGRLLVGTTSALTTTDASKAKLVVNGDTDGSGYPGRIAINNSVATVLTNYKLGEIHFSGQAAGNTAGSISCVAESNWNTGGDTTDNPGRLVFSTTADGAGSPTERMRIDSTGAVTKATNPCLKTSSGDVYASTNNLFTSPAVSVLQANASINIGNTGWTTSGTNAYSFVCPVTGIYAVHAHISLGNITENARTIWSMAYTLGGGNFPLSNYVEVIDVVVDDYMNYSYYEDWYFTAGTRVAMGKNATGYQPGYGFHWGIRLVQ